MKNKIHKILGVGLTLVIAMALVMGFAVPVAASPGETINEWYKFEYPAAGSAGDWFMEGSWDDGEVIWEVRQITEAINGDLYVHVKTVGPAESPPVEYHHIFKSTDGGRSWAATGYEDVEVCETGTPDVYYPPVQVFDMVCSSIDEDILYVTDGQYVYKTDDGGDTFDFVSRATLEEQLEGECDCCINDFRTITCIDVGYDDDETPYVYIGTREHYADCIIADDIPGSIYYIAEGTFGAVWTDVDLSCYGTGYDVFAIGCAPDFADSWEWYSVVSNGGETHVVKGIGGSCPVEFAELKQDCVDPFDIWAASRIGFPDDWEDSESLFVGVTAWPPWTDFGGDVYLVWEDYAQDMNVAGIETGCVGEDPVNIISLDVKGDTDEAEVIAGAFGDPDVYYSYDGGWSWDASDKDPTGTRWTYVIWYEGTALAVTSGCECAVSMSCVSDDVEDVGESWNQISLINTDIEAVRWLGFSPGYVCEDSETMFMVTADWEGPCSDTVSVFRHDGEYWERVFLGAPEGDFGGYDAAPMPFWYLEVSPDFNETNCVYLANRLFEIFRTTDAGCSWKQLTFPCSPRPDLYAMVVIDEDTVVAGVDDDGDYEVWKTVRHGARLWKQYDLPDDVCTPNDFALEPGYEDPGRILLGDRCSQVCISEDGAETWDLVDAALTDPAEYKTWVVFDPTADIIYAAAGDTIARCVIDPDEDWADQEWEELCDQLGEAYGMAIAGGTALYVTDSVTAAAVGGAVTVEGEYDITGVTSATSDTITIIGAIDVDVLADGFEDGETADIISADLIALSSTVVSGTIYIEGDSSGALGSFDTTIVGLSDFTADEDVEASGTLDIDVTGYAPEALGGVLRSLNPDAEDADDVVFERIGPGLEDEETELRRLWLTCDTSDEGCAENFLWSLERIWANVENVWVYEDTLAQPVVLDMPVDEQKLTTTDSATLSWEALCGADCYEVSLFRYCPECPEEKLAVVLDLDCCPVDTVACGPELDCEPTPCTEEICIVVDHLEPGCTYYWQVRVCQGKPTLSKWSEERTFMTALLAVPFAELCSPPCGDQDIILTPNFSWEAVDGATGYDIELATTETFTAGVIRGSPTVNAWVLTDPLEYATTYYWRVRAEKDGVFSDWTICLFTTMEKPVAPTPPVTITPAPPAPVINIPPAQMITPNWIYAVIAIGAALVVVVIVLIVRTRRPPA